MNPTIRTYGVIINLDYSHQSEKQCKAIWSRIVQNMRSADFYFDKRMFLMTTTQDKMSVCDQARTALNEIDKNTEFYNKNSFDYITDFLTIDMTEYVDLRLPPSDMGIVLKDQTLNVSSYAL